MNAAYIQKHRHDETGSEGRMKEGCALKKP
jgi:hypothetical protein